MFAVTAAAATPEDPLAGLVLTDEHTLHVPDGWTTVQVKAASLNHHDLWTLRGVGISPDRLPIVLGCDAAGIDEDGNEVVVHGVIGSSEGDETLASDFSILSEQYDGTFAERVAVPRRNLVPKPASLSFSEAACLPTAWLTAYRMLFTRGRCVPGERVLIQGAGGGVSTALIVLSRAAGLHVTVTSRSASKLEQAAALGAHVTAGSNERLPGRVDVVLETVGEATWSHSLKSLVPGGRVVVAGATSGSAPPADLSRVFYRQLEVIGSTMGTKEELVRLVRFLDATGARPLVDREVAMTEAPTAFAALASGEQFGKIVLTA
jgi:NADPH:quinone reductase-like Zn-dependent oxidoreductase